MNRGKYICSLAKKMLLSKMTDEKLKVVPEQHVTPESVQPSSHIIECSEIVLEQHVTPESVQPSSHIIECSEIVLEQHVTPESVQPSSHIIECSEIVLEQHATPESVQPSSHIIECSEIVLEQHVTPESVQPSSHIIECSEIVLEQHVTPESVQPSSHIIECSEIVLEQHVTPESVQPSSHIIECSEIVLEQHVTPESVQPSSHVIECSMNPDDEVDLDTTAGEMDTTSSVIFDENLSAFVDNSVSSPSTCRPKKGRKQKYEFSRRESQINRNSNKSYVNYKGVKKSEKTFNAYSCSCTMRCHDVVAVEDRKNEHERYWSLASYNAQTAFLGTLVTEKPKNRCYGRDTEKRQHTRVYTLAKKVVCKPMFCNTLNICGARVTTALKKCGNREPLLDQRGTKQGGHNKLSDERVEGVITHINKIPKYVSHYCRKETAAQYLPPDMTISLMYSLYKEEVDTAVSMETYKKIFYTKFNLRFKPLKKDTCNTCDTYKAKLDGERNEEVRIKLSEEIQHHQNLAKYAQDALKADIACAKSNGDTECLTFDMQKTLPLPRIPTNIIYYKRQLWLYNLGVYAGKSGKSWCYCWMEGTAGRGAQEVGSCIRQHLKELNPGVENLILWADSCGGQNRNIKITTLLQAILQSHESLKTVTLKFLYSGHSYLPNDKDFGDIECQLKRQQRMYTPMDYINVMKTCRKRNGLNVKMMEATDFYSTINIEKHIVNRKIDTLGGKVNWMHLREIKLMKGQPYSIFFKNNFTDETYREIDVKRKGRNGREESFENLLVPLWPEGKPISSPKLKDIASILHLIPEDAIHFYKNFTSTPDLVDDIDGFNGVDFEVEENT